ncbi:MAG: hypothetical protein HRT95_05560 [Moritella sp.]|nr:hypothetical protein [Moritella sp.]NQZ49657.1 hypothetical protein [Moritella sp.]
MAALIESADYISQAGSNGATSFDKFLNSKRQLRQFKRKIKSGYIQ